MENDLKMAMDESLIQWATFGLPIFALLLMAIWSVRQRSVICDFWKQFRSQADKSGKLRILNSFAFGVLSFILFILFVVVLAAIGKSGASLLLLDGRDFESLRWLGLTFFGLLTALGGILGAPLALIRINTTERQTRVNEREYTTNLLNQATEHLGANLAGENSSQPNIPLRIGGLLALERIARDNIEDYHMQIMDMICAYIRENSPCGGSDESIENQVPPPGEAVGMDIQFAIDILARRTRAQIDEEHRWEGHRLNLDRTNLTDVDFVRRNRVSNFSNASFRNCSLVGANFVGTNLEGANFNRANLISANLIGTNLMRAMMQNANLHYAKLREANLSSASLTGADLSNANMREASLIGANLATAQLVSADLTMANLSSVNMMEAKLISANLTTANANDVNLGRATVWRATFEDTSLDGSVPEKPVILEYVKKDGPLPSE